MKTVVVVSDMHVGHVLGLAPARVVTRKSENTILANRVQAGIYRVWEQVAAAWHRPDYLVVNGEPVDGPQPRSREETWATDLWTQVDAAHALLNMWGARHLHFTRGSNYHVQLPDGLGLETAVAQAVHANKPDNRDDLVPEEFYLDIGDGPRRWTFHFAHHISVSRSGWIYRTTPIAKEMLLMKLNEERKTWKADIIVRSHTHYHVRVGFKSHLGVSTPCWQFPTWFAYRKGVGDLVPEIGALRFLIDGQLDPDDYQFPHLQVRAVTPPAYEPPVVHAP